MWQVSYTLFISEPSTDLHSFVATVKASHSRLDVWKQVWHIGARGVSHPATSRAACFLLAKMLEADVLPYLEISEELTTIITSADVNGPAILSDSAVDLMSTIFHIRNTKVPNASRSTCSHVIRWLFLRWNPGTSRVHGFSFNADCCS